MWNAWMLFQQIRMNFHHFLLFYFRFVLYLCVVKRWFFLFLGFFFITFLHLMHMLSHVVQSLYLPYIIAFSLYWSPHTWFYGKHLIFYIYLLFFLAISLYVSRFYYYHLFFFFFSAFAFVVVRQLTEIAIVW